MAIIFIVGGIGSGKTIIAVRQLVNRKQHSLTNFDVKLPYVERLKWDDLLVMGDKGKAVGVNWDFWKERQLKGFSIYLDEASALLSARRSMTAQAVHLSSWGTQIRKILGSDNANNLYIITQRPESVDVNFRYLAQWWWRPIKQVFSECLVSTEVIDTKTGRAVIRQLPMARFAWEGYRSYSDYEMGTNKVVYPPFIGNDYYRYYDTHRIVDFGGEEYIP